jgi:DNA mismatch repair ATPase MutS
LLLHISTELYRYYALCALGATFNVVLELTTIVPNTIRFLNQNFVDICHIDHSTATNLELTASLDPKNPRNSLLEAIDNTSTKMGKRLLRICILQPSTGKSFLYACPIWKFCRLWINFKKAVMYFIAFIKCGYFSES